MYCSPEDVRGELYIPLLTQMSAKFSVPGEFDIFLERHIGAASDFVDAALSAAFTVPLALPIPSAVRTATAKEAAYYAAAQFSEAEEILQDRHETAVAMLSAIVAAGRLPGQPSKSTEITGGSDKRVFTDDVLSRW